MTEQETQRGFIIKLWEWVSRMLIPFGAAGGPIAAQPFGVGAAKTFSNSY